MATTNEQEIGSWEYLGFEISNTGNGDGFVLKDPDYSVNGLWRCHLGNFSTREDAKQYALFQWMMDRPETFSSLIRAYYFYSRGLSHEYFTLKKAMTAEGLPIPSEITCSEDMNLSILFNGRRINKMRPICAR